MLKRVLIRSLSKAARRLEDASHDPRPAQAEALRRLVAEVGGSEIGQRHGLLRIRGAEEMRRLPVTDYAVLEEDLSRVARLGAEASGIFGRSGLLALGQTSGSTSEPKRLPVTRAFLNSYRRATLLINASFFYSTGRWEHLLSGKRLILAARPEVARSAGGLSEGFMSGIMAVKAPFWIRSKFLPSSDLLRLESWEEKMEKILAEARREDVQLVAGVPPLVMTFTERALEKFGVGSLRDLWPNLGCFLYGGVALSERSRAWFRDKWLGSPPVGEDRLYFWEIYAATEGQFGHSFHPDWPGMVFNPFENFYQFCEAGDARGPLLQLHELEAGRKYAIHVTTPGGLVNYRMGDWVEILSVRPLTFRVAGRVSEELSLSGEKITPDHVEKAVGFAGAEQGVRIDEYVVWAEEGRPSTLCFGVSSESSSEIGRAGDLPGLAFSLDRGLGAANPTYREMRVNDFLYSEANVYRVPRALFQAYRSRHLDRGQFKGKRLFRSREDFEREYRS